jgi:hypothetical protein
MINGFSAERQLKEEKEKELVHALAAEAGKKKKMKESWGFSERVLFITTRKG